MDKNHLKVIFCNILEEDNSNEITNTLPVAVNLFFPTINDPVFNPLLNIRRKKIPRNRNYFEEIVPLYNLSDFKSHFRMSPTAMEIMIQTVGQQLGQDIEMNILKKKCHFTAWMLTHPETFHAGGDRFDLPDSSGHMIFTEVVNALVKSIDDFIIWPDEIHQAQTSKVFQARSAGFPGIVGVIDATHISINQPKFNATDYFNRKQVHSVILQAVCNEGCKFISVATGFPGRLHDARVFRNSVLGESLNDRIKDREYHLIGDVAYPLKQNLMTPFKDNGHLTRNQLRYNKRLSTVRSTIERSFSRLKGKFRRLRLLEIKNLHTISATIIACCVLHNLILDVDDLSDDEDAPGDENTVDGDDTEVSSAQATDRRAISKRLMISSVV